MDNVICSNNLFLEKKKQKELDLHKRIWFIRLGVKDALLRYIIFVNNFDVFN